MAPPTNKPRTTMVQVDHFTLNSKKEFRVRNNIVWILLMLALALSLRFPLLLKPNVYFSDVLPGVAKPSQDQKNGGKLEVLRTAGSVPGLRIGKAALSPVPSKIANQYYVFKEKGIERAFRSSFHEWERTEYQGNAAIVWEHWFRQETLMMSTPWQRVNHFPRSQMFLKGQLPGELNRYKNRTGWDLPFLPDVYRLYVQSERNEFLERLQNGGGMGVPWVMKHGRKHGGGKAVSMLGPHSDELRSLEHRTKSMDPAIKSYLVEQYVCNELTYEGRKFNLRVYMFVASLDPLVVLYHDGVLFIAPGMHDEKNFSSKRAHVTNQMREMYAADETDSATFAPWEEQLREHVASTPSLQHISDPLGHIRSQMKAALALVIEAVRDSAFGMEGVKAENLFELFGPDFLIDKNLNVWLIEVNWAPYVREEAHRDVYDRMFPEMLSLVNEIIDRQAKGEAILPLNSLHGFELIYTDEEVYRHDFGERGENECTS